VNEKGESARRECRREWRRRKSDDERLAPKRKRTRECEGESRRRCKGECDTRRGASRENRNGVEKGEDIKDDERRKRDLRIERGEKLKRRRGREVDDGGAEEKTSRRDGKERERKGGGLGRESNSGERTTKREKEKKRASRKTKDYEEVDVSDE
jgi:hypothetical protein